jgi:GldM N-terminal domain
MFSLTEQQIAFIENDIKVRGITSPDLSIDLLDHICCIIENTRDGYRNFETVYEETLLLFGEKGLKELQDETNRLLTFKHYYIMNSTMKISGYISSLMILSGAFFKFNHWPGANVFMLVGVFLLTVLFLPLLFILKFKESAESNRSVALSIIGFVAAFLICIGIFFKIMHWPGAQFMIISGGVLLLLGYLPIYFISIYKNTTNKLNSTATVILIIAGVSLLSTETWISGIPRTTSDSFWRGVTESNDLLNFSIQENDKRYEIAVKQLSTDSSGRKSESILQLKNATDELMTYTKKMKAFLISKTEGISEAEAEKINLDALRTAGGGDILPDLLFGEKSSPYSAKQLQNKIESYKQVVEKIAPSTDLKKLNTGNFMMYGEEVSWEQSNFDQLPIALIIFNIIRIELGINATESAALNQI